MPIVATSQLPCNIQSLSLLCDFLVDYPGELQEQADKHAAEFKKMAQPASPPRITLALAARLVATGNFLGWEDSSWPGSSASFEAHLEGAFLAENPLTALDKSPVVV
ncbi:hypothetical protein BKA83DRAFT_4133978 [Pisolithus microcarpus]|nr:hypothetical protein BKA83DRAFT_4133978 [Pisolithus microcarpus]